MLTTTTLPCTGTGVRVCIDGIERAYLNVHYTKKHPSPDPDIFDVRLIPEEAEDIEFFDDVEVTKDGVTEFYGFVEEITPEVGEDGLEYYLSGRCWKLVTWKKFTERYQESRDIGPEDSEGNMETGFFGAVYPEELIKFIMRCPVSEHPKGKIRHKIGWGIASDSWDYCASHTADSHYPDWVGLRYTGLAWRDRGGVNTYYYDTLVVNGLAGGTREWTEDGASPYLHTDSYATDWIQSTIVLGAQEGNFGFANLPAGRDFVTRTRLYVKEKGWGNASWIETWIYDGITWNFVGYLDDCTWGQGCTKEFEVTKWLDTTDKINDAEIRFVVGKGGTGVVRIFYAYLLVESSGAVSIPYQHQDEYFVIDMRSPYDRVVGMLVECRNNPTLYARNYNIQYAIISNCCDEANNDSYWYDFTPAVDVTDNEARDILHSWHPEDDVQCIRIKITLSADTAWEISQVYIWQADNHKYMLMDEEG